MIDHHDLGVRFGSLDGIQSAESDIKFGGVGGHGVALDYCNMARRHHLKTELYEALCMTLVWVHPQSLGTRQQCPAIASSLVPDSSR